MSDLSKIAAALVLRPGDKLLFHIASYISREDAEALHARVKETWPDVPTMVVSGDLSVSVVRVVEDSQ